MNRYLTLIGIAFLVITFNAAASEKQPSKPFINQSLNAYLKPQRFAILKDGRKIHLYCFGTGSPTVIFTAGAGNWVETWRYVQAPIAGKVRTCAWDRAGFGFSDPSADPQDVGHTTTDLEQALKSAKINGPYLMVGHSLGGFESMLFADRHPGEVLGMVLVDPSVPVLAKVLKAVSPKSERESRDYREKLAACVAKLKSGTLTTDPPHTVGCLGVLISSPGNRSEAMVKLEANPNRALTRLSLLEQIGQSSEIAVNEKRNYGAMPLIILTASDQQPTPADLPKDVVTERSAFRLEARRAHAAMAKVSTNGTNLLVSGSGHFIQNDKPEAVVSAIDEVLQKIHAQSAPSSK